MRANRTRIQLEESALCLSMLANDTVSMACARVKKSIVGEPILNTLIVSRGGLDMTAQP